MLRLCCAAHERMRAKPLAFDDFFVCAGQKRSALSGTLRCGPTIGAEWDRGLGNRNRNVWQSACLGPSWLGGSDVSLKTGWNSPVRLALERRRVGCSSPMCLEASSPAARVRLLMLFFVLKINVPGRAPCRLAFRIIPSSRPALRRLRVTGSEGWGGWRCRARRCP